MLRVLTIRDFVIVERAELELGRGFNVLTGETGAGKSILVDALELLVGGRGDAAVVRAGAERAELSAEFDLEATTPLAQRLAEQGLEGDPGALLLRRGIDRSGRSRAFINGHAATLTQLREVGEHLVDLHGQHAHQSLLRAADQRALLDGFADAGANALACAEAYRAWQRLAALAEEAQAQRARREAEREALEQQVAELRALAPRDGEWEALSAEHRRLAHGSALLAGAQSSLEALGEADGACLPALEAVAGRLGALSVHDAQLAPIVELLESANAQAGEALRLLRQYASRVELDPQALHEAEARIEALHATARKHRVRPEALPQLAAERAAQFAEHALAQDPEALGREVAAAAARHREEAKRLSDKRARAAKALSRAVSAEMQALAMKGGRFAIALRALEAPGASGAEAIEFEVRSHESLPMRTLARVASGGELARISLALQLVAARYAPVGTLVFDEVDSGIGGAVAGTVGRALRTLGRTRQVLCVTHLPQVAAQGDAQWGVRRSDERGAVRIAVSRLEGKARVDELARMLGGETVTATTRRHAAELLEGPRS